MTRAALESLDKEALIQLVLAQVSVIERLTERVAELEARLGKPPKTPGNSSVPPSRGNKASEPAAMKAKSKVHPGSARSLDPEPTRTQHVFASACSCCGCDVSGAAQFACESYDRIDIPPVKPDVTRVVLHGGACPRCAEPFKAAAPAGLEPGSPFGPNLRALVIYLRSVQGIPLERLRRALRDLFGLEISEGALVNILKAARTAFSAQAKAIRERLLSGTTIASDETGMRVGKANWWLWVFLNPDSALFALKPFRSRAVVDDVLGDFRPEYWLSDRYGAQMNQATGDHQVCLAHLIRDVQYLIDCGDAVLAPAFKGLLKRACAIGRRRPALADATLKTYQRDLDRRLDLIMQRQPTHEAGLKLKRLIKKIRRHLFVFVTVRALEATNNGSERALRPSAVYRKITNGFRSKWAAEHYADVRSVIETARRRTIGAFEAIKLTLGGTLLPVSAPARPSG